MKKILSILAIIAFSTTMLVAGSKPVKIGTGSKTGNYFSMTQDIFSENYCKDSLGRDFQILNTGGSVDNLLSLANKKVSMGIVQSDVLMNMSKTSPRKFNMNSIKIIAGLHNETVHLLIPKNYAPKTGSSGMWGKMSSWVNAKEPMAVKLESLTNQEISSWGGSIVSAKALSYFFNLNWKVKTISPDSAAKANTPIILVGGQPYAPVEKLLATGKWRLLSIRHSDVASKAPFYSAEEASYNINGNPTIVPTIGVQALLVGKSFRKKSRNEGNVNLATCISESLPDLADDSETNPNWASVYENNEKGLSINWSQFNLK